MVPDGLYLLWSHEGDKNKVMLTPFSSLPELIFSAPKRAGVQET